MTGADTVSFGEKLHLARRVARVGIGVARDRIAPRKAHHPDDVPASVAQITPEWLTAVLFRGAPGATVLDARVTHGSAGTSTRAGLALEFNAEGRRTGVPDRLFTKSSPTFVQRMFLGFAGSLVAEPGFYNHIRPQLDIEAPRGFWAVADPVTWRSMVIMDDVGVTRRARFISTETRIDRRLMEELLGNIAKWHGFFWQSPQLGTTLGWLREPLVFLAELNKFMDMKGRAAIAIGKYPHLVPEDIRHRVDDMFRAALRSFEINARMPRTLLHGDCHIGQTYLTADGGVGIADWQVPMQGGWAYDVNYAIVSALTVEDRRAWERDLLRHYLDRLHANGGPALDFDAAWLAYRQHALYPFFAWAYTRAGAGALQPEFQADYVCNDIMTRTAHAVSDLESIAAVDQ